MTKHTITFRLAGANKKALDSIAESMNRDRSYVLNEAISNYLEIYRWQLAHIKEGARQADRGQYAEEHEVKAAFSRWRK